MEVLAVHTASVTVDPRDDADWLDGQTAELAGGAIVAVADVEAGDRTATEFVAGAAGADLEAIAAELGAETIVVVPAAQDTETAGPVLEALADTLSCQSLLVPPHAYPELTANGTVHPTALQSRRYDGWLPSRSEQDASEWTSPPAEPSATLQDAGVLAADGPDAWTPTGQYLVDELTSRCKTQAIEAGARPVSLRDRTGGPPPTPPAGATGQLHYGIHTLPDGPRPEITCRARDTAQLRSCCRALVSVLLDPPTLFEQSCRVTLARSDSIGADAVVEVFEEAVELDSRTDSAALPNPVQVVLTVGIEPTAGPRSTADGPPTPLGRLVVATIDGGWCLQCAPLGRLDRTLGMLLDHPRPILTPAIAPTQLRLVPVGQAHVGTCDDIVDHLAPVRVDIDDRSQPVGDRLQTVRAEGVPYYAVVGRREAKAGTLPVTERTTQTETEVSVDAIGDAFPGLVAAGGRQRYGPRLLSDR
jgi:hypothetical protein